MGIDARNDLALKDEFKISKKKKSNTTIVLLILLL